MNGMLEPAPRSSPGTEPGRQSGVELLVVLRGAGIAAAVLALGLWPRMGAHYGIAFWLWVAGIVVYAASFRGALREHPRVPALTVLWLVGIVGLAVALRLPGIDVNPANISIDELLPGKEAMRIVQSEKPNVFASVGWFSIPNLTFAIPAVVMQLTSFPPFAALRLSSMLTGIGGIVCTFLLARRLFGDRPALLASFFMAVGFWHIHNSRTGFPYIQSSTCTGLVLYLLVRARQDHSRALLAIAGIALGLCLECYFPVRILLVLSPLCLAGDWLAQRSGWRTMLAEAAIVGVGTLLVLGPLVLSVPWEALGGHSRDVLLTRPAALAELSRRYHVSGLIPVFHQNVLEAAAMFTKWADVAVLNRSPTGLLDVGTLAALLAGMLLAILQGRWYPLLVLGWAVLTFVFGVGLSDAPRASYRFAPAMPALFILAAFAVERVLLVTPPPGRWYRLTVRPAVLAVLALWVGMQNYQMFFVDYANGDGKESPWAAAMRMMSANCDGRQFYVIAGSDPFANSPTLDLFCAEHRALDAEAVPAFVDTGHPATFIVVWNTAPLGTLRRCYPSAPVAEHHAVDGRLLFTHVDVSIRELVAGRVLCPTAQHNRLTQE